MTHDLLSGVAERRGHFLLESGYHTDLWLTLDALFLDPGAIAPLVGALAERLRPHEVSAVCGPLQGGAFLAQAIATALGVRFYFTEPVPPTSATGMFGATYRLPAGLRQHVQGERVAVVDDVISVGSSVRATVAALTSAGALPVVVAALLLLGAEGLAHFAERGVEVEALKQRAFVLWRPEDCPLCRAGQMLEDPRAAQ